MLLKDKVRGRANVSKGRLRNWKCSASCLPPIATFSQRYVDVYKSSESTLRQRRAVRKRCGHRKEFYCTWSGCPRALNRIPFSHKCRLKYHMLGHLNKKSHKCSQCDAAFTTTLNLKRHLTVHQGSKPYKCNVCSREFARSSEWSRCRKHHRLKEEAIKAANKVAHEVSNGLTEPSNHGTTSSHAITDKSSVDLPTLTVEHTDPERTRCKPYKCPVCRRPRAYVDPGSLRKHMRLHHPDYKTKEASEKAAKSSSTLKEQSMTAAISDPPATTSTLTMVPPLLIPVVATETVANVAAGPDASVVTLPCYCPERLILGPMWIRGSQDGLLNQTVESDREAETAYAATDSTCNPLPVPLLTTERSSFMVWEQHPVTQLRHRHTIALSTIPDTTVPNEPMHSSEESFEERIEDDETHRWNAPVDLCNSAMCLQAISDKITDFPMYTLTMEKSSQLESDNTDLVAFLNDSCVINQSVALDLTEPPAYITVPNEVIDLSGDTTLALAPLDPIDLSAPHPPKKDRPSIGHQSAVNASAASRSNAPLVNWDPEPGFSFTDLLTNNDLEDPDTIFNYLLSNDLSMHPSPCKSANAVSNCSVTSVAPATTALPTAAIHTQPPLDLRLPHAALFPL